MDGFAYLVDRHGKIVFHPDPSQVGLDVSKLPFVEQVMAGKSGGSTYISATNQQMLEANVPVAGAGWGLIVQESWNSAFSDSRIYGLIVVGVGLLAILLVAYLAWRGVQRIVKPILLLADQTNNLASNDSITPFPQTGILEIDTLEKDFSKMAGQIAVYRAGLRRYVGAMTQSQEDERRRLARELHDETTQNLLAISRRLELYRDAEEDARYKERWQELHTIVNETLSGVRQMSQDLRPLILEDLGLIPALQTLVRNAQQGTGALPHAKLEVSGNPCPLTPEQELAIYRITQEALNNVLKHSRATAAWVGLEYGPNQVSLSIRDDGNGFEVPESIATFTQSGSFGLMGIQERVWAQAGTLTINSNPHQGTQIQVILPIIRETK
jgi:signal transduction histidine kinase